MGFFSKQFVDVIEWNENENGVLSFRFPMEDQEIQNGAKLTVRESQLALFVNEGELADQFQPGLHTLTTKTLPLLTNLKNWDKLFQSPFKSDVYFFSTREQIDQRWGTQSPIVIRDRELGPIRLRAHGSYSYRLADPKIFFKKISGTKAQYTTQELEGQLRATILTSIATYLGNAQVSFLDMAANQVKFSETLKAVLSNSINEYGLKLETFFVQSISLPEELQSRLDKVASMQMVGDLKRYAQFQTAESIPLAAQNEGGAAGIGVGLGAGMTIGQTMASALGGSIGTANSSGSQQGSDDPIIMIEKLHGLLAKGVITQSEFDAKKAELLKKIT
ncbi:MAG TPA: SPFH domain-containing protein [Pseudobdellovibrionaceae bacterium]|nr:SPFH domain-containing protein [Pseudobdellovibrionaceae bacterium]